MSRTCHHELELPILHHGRPRKQDLKVTKKSVRINPSKIIR